MQYVERKNMKTTSWVQIKIKCWVLNDGFVLLQSILTGESWGQSKVAEADRPRGRPDCRWSWRMHSLHPATCPICQQQVWSSVQSSSWLSCHTHKHTHTHVHACAHTHSLTLCTHTHTLYAHTHAQTHPHTRAHTHTHTHTHTMHTHTHSAHTYPPTHTHT